MDIAKLIVQAFYYILVVITIFLGIFAVYVLIRYGRSRMFSLILSLVFIFFFLTALSQSYSTLQSII
jgi:hypothetical protein